MPLPPQIRYDNAGILGNLPDNAARSAALRANNGNGEVVTVNVTPDKEMSAPVGDAFRGYAKHDACCVLTAECVLCCALQEASRICVLNMIGSNMPSFLLQIYVYYDLDNYYQNYRRCAPTAIASSSSPLHPVSYHCTRATSSSCQL